MTTITTATRSTGSTTTEGRVSWRNGVATGAVAAAVVAGVAALFSAAGHALTLTDGVIPVLGFAQLVLIGALVGTVIARHTSRRTFLRTTIVLTVLSCVPSVLLGASVADRAGLVLTHLVAAAIIVPRLARR